MKKQPLPLWQKLLNSVFSYGLVTMIVYMLFAGFHLLAAGIYSISLVGIAIPVATRSLNVFGFIREVWSCFIDGLLYIFEVIGEIFA